MDLAQRLAFEKFLRRLRAAYAIAFRAETAAEQRKRDDVRLFAMTFACGFTFMSLFIA
ncbi:hypothetical protein [Sphingomicrobium marinum]|uniref:hypothetical protein n=1 Tax=Sphingomicrobium marinum TaxID=1227950 RepID=UPI00223F98FD|nr:hypothetical protein [Sphingomicrobium marinum]